MRLCGVKRRPAQKWEEEEEEEHTFWYSPRLVFIISFWSNPIGLCSLAYICTSIGILRCSTRIGFGSYSFRVIHYTSLCCHRTSFDPPSFIRRRLPTPELCYSGSPSWPYIDSMRLCIDDIKDWMTGNKLKLNDDKTEVMIISSSRMSTALSIPESFDIGNASVPFSDTVKNLGVTLDCHLSLKTHVLNVVRTANFELRRISSIRRLLTTEATATLVSAFILSRLDYCNSLLSGCPRSLILRLQKVQNNAARLILGISKREHISPHLASLHWLPIDSRIKYKLACICYNCMSTNYPPYLSDLLPVYTAARQHRSSSDNYVLRRPSVRTVSYGQRSFSYSAPSAWNSLPQQVRSSHNVSTFRSRNKTHLFRLAY